MEPNTITSTVTYPSKLHVTTVTLLQKSRPHANQPVSANTHTEQLALFRDADIFIAPHGAAHTNTLLMKPGSLVYELFPFRVDSTCKYILLDVPFRTVLTTRGSIQPESEE